MYLKDSKAKAGIDAQHEQRRFVFRGTAQAGFAGMFLLMHKFGNKKAFWGLIGVTGLSSIWWLNLPKGSAGRAKLQAAKKLQAKLDEYIG